MAISRSDMIIGFVCSTADSVPIGNDAISSLDSDIPSIAALLDCTSMLCDGDMLICDSVITIVVGVMMAVGVLLGILIGVLVGTKGVGVFDGVGAGVGVWVGPVIAIVFSPDHVGLLQLPVYRPTLKRYSPGPL